jgi:glucose/arabinose dehydrogenase
MRAVVLSLGLLAATAHPAPGLRVPASFSIERIASVGGARELAVLPNGDLLVGTKGPDVYIVPDAEGSSTQPQRFAAFDDDRAAGVTFAPTRREIYVATVHHVWSIPYRGERTATQATRIADIRAGSEAPGSDGDVHLSTSVAYAGGLLYVAAGSSCNATMGDGKPCAEVDRSRASISVMKSDGSGVLQRATRIRNAIALAVNPETGAVWVGDAGQDDLPAGHPYEFLDDLSAHPGVADYGWPQCEENDRAYTPGANCSQTVEPLVELPAYSTIVGAAFYPTHQSGRYAFPPSYRGGLFVTAHGSWHQTPNGCSAAPARVVFVAMSGDRPSKSVDWSNPTTQWTDFVTGFQSGCTARIGRPTGIAVGPKGSLFIADDQSGSIYRVRPTHD